MSRSFLSYYMLFISSCPWDVGVQIIVFSVHFNELKILSFKPEEVLRWNVWGRKCYIKSFKLGGAHEEDPGSVVMDVFWWVYRLSVYHPLRCPIILSCSALGLNICFPSRTAFPPSFVFVSLCILPRRQTLYIFSASLLCPRHVFILDSKEPGVLFHSLFPRSFPLLRLSLWEVAI